MLCTLPFLQFVDVNDPSNNAADESTSCTSGNAQPDKAQDLAEDEEDDGSHETAKTVQQTTKGVR